MWHLGEDRLTTVPPRSLCVALMCLGGRIHATQTWQPGKGFG